jgi:hypothetical protein
MGGDTCRKALSPLLDGGPISFEYRSAMVVVEEVSVEGASYPLLGMRRLPGSFQESSAWR